MTGLIDVSHYLSSVELSLLHLITSMLIKLSAIVVRSLRFDADECGSRNNAPAYCFFASMIAASHHILAGLN